MTLNFKRSYQGAPKKGKKISPIKNNSAPQDPTLPSQKIGIYLKITADTPFEIKKIALLRVAIFELLKSMFLLKINCDIFLLIALQDSKSADTQQKSLVNISIKSALRTPNQNSSVQHPSRHMYSGAKGGAF